MEKFFFKDFFLMYCVRSNMKTFKIHFMYIIGNKYDVFIFHSENLKFNVALNTDLYIYSRGKCLCYINHTFLCSYHLSTYIFLNTLFIYISIYFFCSFPAIARISLKIPLKYYFRPVLFYFFFH